MGLGWFYDAHRAEMDCHALLAVLQAELPVTHPTGLARQLVASRQLDAATRLLDEGIARSSQPGELHFALGLVAGQQKNWKEAAAQLQRAAELMPDHRHPRRNREAVQQ